jgi:ABC-2 type transport system permease protein
VHRDPSLPLPPDAPSATDAPAARHPVRPLVSAPEEARAFWRMRRRMVATVLKQTFFAGRLRVSIIVVLSLTLWGMLFGVFYKGFEFVESTVPSPDMHALVVRAVFERFFLALMVMLVFSAAIILYSSLFKARDVPFLLALPSRAERVFLNKFQEAILMSSWAFLLLGSPMLLAYGLIARAPWHYYGMLLPFLLAFVYVPAALGALACLFVVHRYPQARWHVLVAAGVAAIVAGLWFVWSVTRGSESNLLTARWFGQMIGRLSIGETRLLPSWWLSAGLLQASQRDSREWPDAVMFLVLLVSTALFFRQLAIWTSASLYRDAYSRLHGRAVGHRRARVAWIDRALVRMTPLLSPQIRLLMIKDMRLFRRDPVQWSQFLIFAGLLVIYFFFLNVRRYSYEIQYVGWVNVVSFLNVSVIGLLLSTFTTRFIFPMISLEGRRFAVLGLLPVRRETILWSKFIFAVGASIIPCSLLVAMSDLMLRVDGTTVAAHQWMCLLLSLGLSGIAVGLGAKMPSLREQSPARIAAGFGGTLTLVLSTLYILAVVVLIAVPCHFYLGTRYSHATDIFTTMPWLHRWLSVWLIGGIVGSLGLGILATAVPLRIGFRAFRKLEF